MYIRVNVRDNVAILVHPEGVKPGALLPDGLVARERIPQSHKIALRALAAGQPVLVDFTADWCLTCQLNLRTSLDAPKVRAKLAEVKAVMLIGDYTLQDETIGKELHRFGRDAVPLVLVFPKNPGSEPIVLPPLLGPQMVLDALEKAAQ